MRATVITISAMRDDGSTLLAALVGVAVVSALVVVGFAFLGDLVSRLKAAFPGLPNPRWIALRLLGGDESMLEALRSGQLGTLHSTAAVETSRASGGNDP